MRTNQFQQFWMNGTPDRVAHRPLRSGAAGESVQFIEARHVFHRNFDAKLKAFGCACVNHGNGAIDGHKYTGFKFGESLCGDIGCFCSLLGFLWLYRRALPRSLSASQKASDFFQRPLRSRKSDPLKVADRQDVLGVPVKGLDAIPAWWERWNEFHQ